MSQSKMSEQSDFPCSRNLLLPLPLLRAKKKNKKTNPPPKTQQKYAWWEKEDGYERTLKSVIEIKATSFVSKSYYC